MELVKKEHIYHCIGPILNAVESSSPLDLLDGRLHLDLSAISAITSIGLKGFIGWVDGLRLPVTYHNCSVPFVMQLGMVRELIDSKTRIQSFMVPVTCSNCGNSQNLVYESGRDFTPGKGLTSPEAPPQTIEGCELEFDCSEECYFYFLQCLTGA